MNYLKLLWDLAALKRNEKKNPAQIRVLQEKKLRKLLRFAYEHSPYYRDTFAQAGITEKELDTAPLSAFPTLDKAELLSNFDRLITVKDLTQEALRRFDAEAAADRSPYLGRYHVVHSSGSTGKPGYFLYDDRAWREMLLGIIRGALWDMSMPQILKLLQVGPRIAYIAATDGRYGGAMAVGDGIEGLRCQQLHLDIKTPLNEWVRQLREFQPNMIIGYPSAIKILAELADSGKLKLSLTRVISCGEPLAPGLRQYLENIFGVCIINFYGASESLALGVESNSAEGIFLFEDMNIIERAPDGIYLTCLYNFAQPLIRYKLSDSLTFQPPVDKYPFRRAVGLLGRCEDLLWFENSAGVQEFLHPLAVEGFCIEGLLDYQFRQTDSRSFEMLAETASTASQAVIQSEMLRQMRDILAEKDLAYVDFGLRFVSQIPADPQTGKKRLIITNWAERSAVV
ncbi:MAG: phenylacetate--CoA ligase family protein [Oscillospiraceae bacterium]|nr:phenylacetate--CoA ligase family protein [Oscillospiraceae bacterium]